MVLGRYNETDERNRLPLTEQQQKEAAIRTSEAVSHGQLPHNPELNLMLDNAATSLQNVQLHGNLSPEGQRIARDAKDVVESMKHVVIEKNQDETLQHLALHSKEATMHAAGAARGATGTGVTSSMRETSEVAMTLARQLATNGELRSTMWDLFRLLRDIMYNEQDTGEAFGESDHRSLFTGTSTQQSSGMQQQGYQTGVQQQGFQTSPTTSRPPSMASSTTGGGVNIQETTISYDDKTGQPVLLSQYRPSFEAQPFQTGTTTATSSSSRPWSSEEEEESHPWQEAWEWMEATGHQSQRPHRVAARFLSHRLRDEEIRELGIRFQNLMRKAHKNPQTTHSLNDFINLLSRTYSKQTTAASSVTSAPGLQDAGKKASQDAKHLIESFAMNKSLDPLINGWRTFARNARNDPQWRNYGHDFKQFFVKSLQEKSFVERPQYAQEFHHLVRRGRALLATQRDFIFALLNEADDFLQCMRRDDTTRHLTDSTKRLANDLFLNESGRVAFKPHVIVELRKILIPVIADQLKYIAIPRIEGSDPKMDYALDNIIFRGSDILPDHVHVENMNIADLDTVRGNDLYLSSIYVRVTNIHANLDNMRFSYNRKTWPTMHDRGELDLLVGGHGITVELWLTASVNDPNHLFRPTRVRCHVDKLKVKNMHGEEHRMLYTILRPIIQSRARRSMVQAVEENVSKIAIMLDERMMQLAHKAKEHFPQAASTVQETRQAPSLGPAMHGNIDTTSGKRYY